MTFADMNYESYRARNSFLAKVANQAAKMWRAVHRNHDNRKAVAHLRSMSDYQLQDIGLNRAEIAYAVNNNRTVGMDPRYAA